MADRELGELREELLLGLRRDLPEQGFEAFQRHQLLTIRFHRASRVNAPAAGERNGWRQFFREHFPRGDSQALLLWERWRNALVKDEYPGPGVAISHGQPHGHWRIVSSGALFVNLENMWDDYESSLDSMIHALEADPDRRAKSVEWWNARRWSVQLVQVPPVYDGGPAPRRLRPFRSARQRSSPRRSGRAAS